MRYRTFGKTGLEVSEIGFGAWQIGGGGWGGADDERSRAALRAALDRGVTFLDTAAGYGGGHSEKLIAEVLAERGDRPTVATKTPPTKGPWPPSPYCDPEQRYSGSYLRENVEERLRNLDTDCLDVLLLHSWTRAWNDDPTPLKRLRAMQAEGKIGRIGISTPEQDQNCAVQLMRDGMVDVVELIYNIFEQEPAAQLLPVAQETGTAIIGRVPFDESSLTGKLRKDTTFPQGDMRNVYFAGDRLERVVERVEKLRAQVEPAGWSLPHAALKFCLAHPAVSTVIPGMRSPEQVETNCAASDVPDLEPDLLKELQNHYWRRGFWYGR